MSNILKTYNNIIDTIGNTPIVKLNRFSSGLFNIYAKCEFLNPGGSIKDRIGPAMIVEAEKQGLLKPGYTIVEATAGNTGVGLAMYAIQKGYKMIAVVTDKASSDKVNLLKTLGATICTVPYTNSNEHPGHFIEHARKLAKTIPNSWFVDQFYNKTNLDVHYKTTGPEIWEQMQGKVDVFISGAGTGGTVCGAGRFLKEKNPRLKIILADPVGSIHADLVWKNKNFLASNYLVEGIGGDFTPGNLDLSLIDGAIQIKDIESCMTCHELLHKEGIFAGASSGTTLAAALSYRSSTKIERSINIVIVLPDSGRNYMDTFYNANWCKNKFNYILSKEELLQYEA